jgi:peptide/nickel transport system substrate-binding protein
MSSPAQRSVPFKIISLLAAGCLSVGALVGCAPAGSQQQGSSDDDAATTLIVARTADVDKLDPHLATDFQTVQTLGLVYSRLVTTDADGKIAPDLASEWTVSEDGKQVTFTLRRGVKWHDGSPFTAADVKATLERILDEKTAAVARSNLTMITGVESPDDQTVQLTLSAPSTALLYSLASTNASVVQASAIEADTVASKPVGTGPYAWDKWTQGQQIRLKKTGGGQPATLEFRVIPEESSILSGMKSGAFQIGLISDPAIARRATDDGYTLKKQPSLAYHALMLNGRRGPLKEQKVRQAISCAVDRDELIKTAAFGDGTPTGPITSPAYVYDSYDGLPCEPGDTEAAKRLLAEAGHQDGFELNTIVMSGDYASAVPEGQNLKSQLAEIGVELQLKQLSSAPYVNAWLAGDYDAAVALNGGSQDPYLMYGRYWGEGASLTKPAGTTSEPLAQLLAEGNATDDEAERQQVFGDLQKQLLVESPWVWTFRSDDYYLVGKTVTGFSPRADQSLISLADTKA